MAGLTLNPFFPVEYGKRWAVPRESPWKTAAPAHSGKLHSQWKIAATQIPATGKNGGHLLAFLAGTAFPVRSSAEFLAEVENKLSLFPLLLLSIGMGVDGGVSSHRLRRAFVGGNGWGFCVIFMCIDFLKIDDFRSEAGNCNWFWNKLHTLPLISIRTTKKKAVFT